jgi:beta-glucosidase/6-phospho-beta-glucosidase/beta-galactosidase
MYDAVKAGDKADADSDGSPAEVGIVYNMAPAEPADPNDPVDVEGAQNVFYLYNMAFLNAVALGMWDEDLDGQAVYREDLDHRMDYIGLNYYTKVVVKGTKVPLLPSLSVLTTFNPYVMEFDWDYPEGIYEMSVLIRDQLSQPVIITENGTQDPNDDGSGGSYIVRHLTWLSRAMDEGVDVRGYFYWTLMDNYEWNHGMNIRMGLFAVSATDPLKTRTARKSVGVYAGIAGSGSISPALQAAYPAD